MNAPSPPATLADLERLREAVERQLVDLREEVERQIASAEARAVRKAADRVGRRLT